MNKRDAFKKAKEIFPQLRPTRLSGFSVEEGMLLMPCHDMDAVVVINSKSDLEKLATMVQVTLASWR